MESKTMLLDLVQKRKDGEITQEEMVRQLVQLRSQATGAADTNGQFISSQDATAVVTSSVAENSAAEVVIQQPADKDNERDSQQHSVLKANLEKQREQILIDRRQHKFAPRKAWVQSPEAKSDTKAKAMRPGSANSEKPSIEQMYNKFIAMTRAETVNWAMLFDRFDADGDGLVDFDEFLRAVRRDRKVTRAVVPDREMRIIFDSVDVGRTGKISSEELCERLFENRVAQRTDSDPSQGWEGTSGSEASDLPFSKRGQSSSSFVSSSTGTNRRGRPSSLGQRLKAEEEAKCTFTPNVGRLPAQYSKSQNSASQSPFTARANQWLQKRNEKIDSERRLVESKETAGCTFRPRISPATRAKQKQARSGRSREAEFERLYSERLGRTEAISKKVNQSDCREDGGDWFKPKINDTKHNIPPENFSKPVVRKVGAVTQQLLKKREGENTFTPKTNKVPSKFGCAAEYLADNAFDRLSRPVQTGSKEDTLDISEGERLFDSIYEFGHDGTQRSKQTQATKAQLSQASRNRTGNNTSTSRSAYSRPDEFYVKTQRWAEKKQSKLKQKAEQVAAETEIKSPIMTEHSRKLTEGRRDGDFLDRLAADATMRDSNAYFHAAKRTEDDGHTFKPKINPSSKQLRARSVDELSRGDHEHNLDLRKQAHQQSDEQHRKQFNFAPRLNHAPGVTGRLMLNSKEGRETYLDRIKEAHEDLHQAIAEHRARRQDQELEECTFAPEIRDAPQYVKRIANSMKLTRSAKPVPQKTQHSFLSAVSHD